VIDFFDNYIELTTLQSCVYCATVQQDWGRLPLPSSAVVHQKGSKIVLQNVVVAKVRRADLPPKKSSSFCCTTTNQINQSILAYTTAHIISIHYYSTL